MKQSLLNVFLSPIILGSMALLMSACGGPAGDSGATEATGTSSQALVAACDGDEGEGSADPCALVRCMQGTHCVADGEQATCAADVFCGGIAGMACPGAGECVDDPSDDCDPEGGGADCGGLCECSGALVLCAPGSIFDEDPEVCACVESPCNLVDCAPGNTCVVEAGEAVCVPDAPAAPFCGGIAAIPCPGAGQCVDDPSDDCDPENGGADCGGVCDCTGVLALCLPGTRFDDNPEVCACVPAEVTTCAAVTCPVGHDCIESPEGAYCAAPVTTCAAVTCLVGYACVEGPEGARCVPPRPRRTHRHHHPRRPQRHRH